MKWKARTETTNIGVLELGNITLDEDYMEVCIDICDMSEDLKEEVAKAIEVAKVKYIEWEQMMNNRYKSTYNSVWSNQPVVMDFTYLRVRLEAGKPIDYSIQVGFHDAIDELIEQWDCSITVDLSAYTNELKKAIIKVLIDKFF